MLFVLKENKSDQSAGNYSCLKMETKHKVSDSINVIKKL